MGEIIRNLKNFNNLFITSEIIYDTNLSYEERIIFENDFVNKCVAITSDKQPLYNFSNVQCKYIFDYQSLKMEFDAIYVTTCTINLSEYTTARLIYSSIGDEILGSDTIVLFDYIGSYKIYQTQKELIRKLKSLVSFNENRIIYVAVFDTKDYLDSRIFKKMIKNVKGKKDNVSLIVYKLLEDDFLTNKKEKHVKQIADIN
jgi:hypothetical protein